MPQDNDDKKKLLQESTTNSNTMKRNMSNPGLYNQLDQSQWMWTPPGATHKRFGKKRTTKKPLAPVGLGVAIPHHFYL